MGISRKPRGKDQRREFSSTSANLVPSKRVTLCGSETFHESGANTRNTAELTGTSMSRLRRFRMASSWLGAIGMSLSSIVSETPSS